MKHQYKSYFLVLALLTIAAAQAAKRQSTTKSPHLLQNEIEEILNSSEPYAYFGPELCSLSSDLPALRKMAAAAGVEAKHVNALCEIAAQGYTTAPAEMVKAALEEAVACVAACKAEMTTQELTRIADALEAYDQTLQSGAADVIATDDPAYAQGSGGQVEEDSEETQTRGTKKFDTVVIRRQASIGSLYVGGDTIINHNLTVNNDEIVRGNLTVFGDVIFSDTSITFAGNQVVNGNLKVLENIKLPDANAAGTVGVLQLGVDPIYEFNMGTSNFFAGDYTAGMPNPATLTGGHNISIGTGANNALTSSSDTIVIGRAASVSGGAASNSIAIGQGAAVTGAANIALGLVATATSDFTGTIAIGNNTKTGGTNGIAIGTGSSSALNSIALGQGVSAMESNSIAIGTDLNIIPNAGGSITIGQGLIASRPFSVSIASLPGFGETGDFSVAIGAGSIATGFGAHALGGRALGAGSIALGGNAIAQLDNSMAIGNSAQAFSPNSIAIGTNNATANSDNSIAIGNNAQASFPNSIAIGTNVATTSTGTFIDGIYNALVVGQSVTVKADGQLGTTISARRFKENFRNLDNHSAQIYKLNPVKFDYKAEHGGAKDQFGLIADEVAQHLPEIVVHDKDGEIYSVQYHVLPTLLLNEMKHLKQACDEHKQRLDAQVILNNKLFEEIAVLKAALLRAH